MSVPSVKSVIISAKLKVVLPSPARKTIMSTPSPVESESVP